MAAARWKRERQRIVAGRFLASAATKEKPPKLLSQSLDNRNKLTVCLPRKHSTPTLAASSLNTLLLPPCSRFLSSFLSSRPPFNRHHTSSIKQTQLLHFSIRPTRHSPVPASEHSPKPISPSFSDHHGMANTPPPIAKKYPLPGQQSDMNLSRLNQPLSPTTPM